MIKLTKKERIVKDLLCTGLMVKEISNILHIAVSTISTHRKNILRKLNKNTIKELMYDEIKNLKNQIEALNKEVKRLKIFEQRWNYLKQYCVTSADANVRVVI